MLLFVAVASDPSNLGAESYFLLDEAAGPQPSQIGNDTGFVQVNGVLVIDHGNRIEERLEVPPVRHERNVFESSENIDPNPVR